jgi:hypothetical protein
MEIVIKFSDEQFTAPCAFCSTKVEVSYGPTLFVDGTRNPVCYKCGWLHGDDITYLLSTFELLIGYGRSLNTTKDHMEIMNKITEAYPRRKMDICPLDDLPQGEGEV